MSDILNIDPDGVADPAADPVIEPVADPVTEPADGDELVTEPADGERPEWVPEKFWDKESGTADYKKLSESYKELESKIGKGGNAAPKDGYDISNILDAGIEADNEMLVEFQDIAAESGLSQDAFDKFFNRVLESEEASMEIDKAAELEKLGKNSAVIVTSVSNWLNGLIQSGTVTAEQATWLKSSSDANMISLLHNIMKTTVSPDIPAVLGTAQGKESITARIDKLGKKFKAGNYADTALSDEIDALYEKLVK